LLSQLVQRAPARSLSLEASGPHRMTATAQASGAWCWQRSHQSHTQGVARCSSPSVGRGPSLRMAGIRPHGGQARQARYMLSAMCGRSTYKLTWEEIVRLYRLTLEQRPVNTQARYNVCPTTTIDTIVGQNGERRLTPMRWGFVPSWWSKPLKELKLATFNARAETVAEKPFFREAFKRLSRSPTNLSPRYMRPAKWDSAVTLHGSNFALRMSALGQKQTFRNVRAMSAIPLKADIRPRR
jgi:SOS response associated peptidase (SRAP)